MPDFMAHAHALILLRLSSAYPCVFYGDIYGILGKKSRPPACGGKLPKMILARKLYAYGGMNEYWDEKECIGNLSTLPPSQPKSCTLLKFGCYPSVTTFSDSHRSDRMDAPWAPIPFTWRRPRRLAQCIACLIRSQTDECGQAACR
jgi:hypothetical protein